MSIQLDPTERRILGSLVEKQLSVPEVYPLTLNTLVLACNQKSNRDPVMDVPEFHVQGALRALRDRGWVLDLELAGARTIRYAHRAIEQLAVDERDLAILAELWLRGPQSPQELKVRASRMRPFSSPEEVENRLRALAARPVPYVKFLGKRPGERTPRWAHAFTGSAEAAEPVVTDAHEATGREREGPEAQTSNAGSVEESAEDVASVVHELAERVEALEREIAALKERMR